MISEFNRRITVNRYEFSQNSAGGNQLANQLPIQSWEMWAKVESSPGSKSLDNLQVSYSKTFRITVRAEETRPIYNEDEIIYMGDSLIIQSITRQDEGRVNFLILDTYITNETTMTYS